MNIDKSLFPGCCPEGYYGHYTVAAEESPAFLASLFSMSEEDLLRANPHITSAETLQPGTKIHIPGLIPFPASIIFSLNGKELPFAHGGGAFIHLSPEGGQSVSIIATLPASSYFGAFDLYIAEVSVTLNNIFEGQLFATPDDPPSWAARIDLPFLTSLSPESRILIRPFNSLSGIAGDAILAIDFSNLPPLNCTAANTDVLSITSEDLPDNEEPEANDSQLFEHTSANSNGALSDEAEVFDDIETISEEYGNQQAEPMELPVAEEAAAENDTLTAAEENCARPGSSDPAAETVSAAEDILSAGGNISTPEAAEFLPEEELLITEKKNDLTDTDLHPAKEVPAEVETVITAEDSSQFSLTEASSAQEGAMTDTAGEYKFQAEPILAKYSSPETSSFPGTSYFPADKNRKPVNLLLNATSDAEYAIGVASIQLQPSQIIISALKLPDPSSLGPQYTYYKAWLIDAGNNKTAAIDMKKILNGVWAGQSSNSVLKAFDLVLITAETSQNVTKPAGPEVLIGILSADI